MGEQQDRANDRSIVGILRRTHTIAMVGASPSLDRPSHGVMRYLQQAGYRVIPVNPTVAGDAILGEPVQPSLADIHEPFEMVDVFRRIDAIPGVVAEILPLIEAQGIRYLWLQLGIRHAEAAARARAAGLEVIVDRCLKIEHQRLINSGSDPDK
ncbi:MAG TPA: CoA-binding protein [Woeseiaceae bacterium]|nr:CoA-binding protein [Woeseiaceae bacterium]